MTTEILCRFDPRDQAPVVFLRDSIDKNQIQVWNGTGNPKYMPLDYYRMTNPLSAEDERVLMERYKSATGKHDQVVRISHRLPRTSRPLPNMLGSDKQESQLKDINQAPTARKGNAKPLDTQPLPQGPTGDLPQPGETLAPIQPPVQTAMNETPSASMFRRIQELNQRVVDLNQKITDLNAEAQKATTDLDAAKAAIKELMTEFEAALEAEAAEELRKRREMLAALSASVSPLAQAAQAMHDSATVATEQAQETQAQAPATEAKHDANTAATSSTKPPAKGPARKAAATKK